MVMILRAETLTLDSPMTNLMVDHLEIKVALVGKAVLMVRAPLYLLVTSVSGPNKVPLKNSFLNADPLKMLELQ